SAPAAIPIKPAMGNTQSAAAVPDTHATHSGERIASPPKPPAFVPPPPPRAQMTPEEAYQQWSAAFSHSGSGWNPFTHGYPSHRRRSGDPPVALRGQAAQRRFDQPEHRALDRARDQHLTIVALQGGRVGKFIAAGERTPDPGDQGASNRAAEEASAE